MADPEPQRTPRLILRLETWAEVRAFFGDVSPSRPDDAGVVFEGTNGRRATLEESWRTSRNTLAVRPKPNRADPTQLLSTIDAFVVEPRRGLRWPVGTRWLYAQTLMGSYSWRPAGTLRNADERAFRFEPS